MDEKIRKAKELLMNGMIRKFLPKSQVAVLGDALRGEEREFFADKIIALDETVRTMPYTYQTDGQGDKAIVHLHYFLGSIDAWVTERDMGEAPNDPNPRQFQAFGKVCLTGDKDDAELGYINIEELIDNGVELDLYWEPKSLKEVFA